MEEMKNANYCSYQSLTVTAHSWKDLVASEATARWIRNFVEQHASVVESSIQIKGPDEVMS